MRNKGTVLVFEDRYNGHHLFHLHLLLSALLEKDYKIILLATERIKETALFDWIKDSFGTENIHYLKSARFGENQKLWLREFKELDDIAEHYNAIHLYFNNIDGWGYNLAAASLFRRQKLFRIKWSLLLLKPVINYKKFGGINPRTDGLKPLIANILRYLSPYIFTKDKMLTKVFIMDEYALRNYFGKLNKNILMLLTDPITDEFYENNYDSNQIRKKFGFDQDCFLYLTFGFHHRYKGTYELLKAYLQFRVQYPELKACLVIAGVIGDKRISSVIQRLEAQELIHKKSLIVWDRYLGDLEGLELIRTADCICTPYLDNWGTSGVLLKALVMGKQVVACEEGWMGLMVKDSGWGSSCNPRCQKSINAALKAVYNNMPKKPWPRRDDFRSKDFQKQLLSVLED